MRYLNLIFFLIFTFLNFSFAKNGYGYFSVGTFCVDLKNLKSYLESKGYPVPNKTVVNIGGGGLGKLKDRIYLGGEGFGYFSTAENENYISYISGGYGLFKIGFNIYSKKNFSILPVFGLGAGGISFILSKKSSNLSLENITPSYQINLYAAYLLTNIGIRLNFHKNFFGLEIESGYLFSPYVTSWKYENTEINDIDKVKVSTPYINVNLAFGKF